MPRRISLPHKTALIMRLESQGKLGEIIATAKPGKKPLYPIMIVSPAVFAAIERSRVRTTYKVIPDIGQFDLT